MEKLDKYADQIYHCTRCGFCQSVCPVYKAVMSEFSVARGKMTLLNGFLNGHLDFTPRLASYLELCTGCMACKEACPSGISTDKIFLAAKETASAKFGLSLPKNAIIKAFSSDKALGFFSVLLNLYTMSKAGFLTSFLPEQTPFISKIKLLNTQLETQNTCNLNGFHYKPDKPSNKILYFPGCINKYVNNSNAFAITELLKHLNCEVLIPQNQMCCGLPAKSLGEMETAKSIATMNLNVFTPEILNEYDHLLVDCASCSYMLGNYTDLFTDNPEKQDHSQLLKSKIIDANSFLVQYDYKNPSATENIKVTYHDPCHLKRSQGIYKEPRDLIKKINNIEYVEMEQSDVCCGASGSFCILNETVSQKISRQKAENIINTQAQIVLTSCPSCKIGISQGLIQAGKELKIMHPAELLYKSVFTTKKR